MFKINKLMIAALLASSEALAHTGHNAPGLHLHEWEYALLTAAVIVVAGAALRWFKARK